jgi:succinate dehydrogenase / fumarate reductase membrane anchor subunit
MSRKAHGLRAWLWQRVSAIGIALYVSFFGTVMLTRPPADYLAWRDFMSNRAVSLATALFFGALLIHAWVGARDVILDYVHGLWFRLLLLCLLGVLLGGCGIWVLGVIYALH